MSAVVGVRVTMGWAGKKGKKMRDGAFGFRA